MAFALARSRRAQHQPLALSLSKRSCRTEGFDKLSPNGGDPAGFDKLSPNGSDPAGFDKFSPNAARRGSFMPVPHA
jgi:hypothetical protein